MGRVLPWWLYGAAWLFLAASVLTLWFSLARPGTGLIYASMLASVASAVLVTAAVTIRPR